MGKMQFHNNGKKSWDMIVDSTARAKNSGCYAVSGWSGSCDRSGSVTHHAWTDYERVGNFGKVSCQIVCAAEAVQYALRTDDRKLVEIWEDGFGKDAPKKYWEISRCQIYAASRSVEISGPYRLNARVKSVRAMNAGKGDANWGGIQAIYEIDWSGMGSTETYKGSVRTYMTGSSLEIDIR